MAAINTNKYLDYNGLSTLWGKIDSLFVRKADIAAEREKLAGIAEGAQVNVIENVAIVAEGATSATANDMVSIVGKTAVIRVENTIPATYNEKTPIRPASTKAVKDYVDQKVADKNVSAEGDSYVSASAAGNKVTVAATSTLTSAVTKANSAVQSAQGDTYVSASAANNKVTVSANVETDLSKSAVATKLASAAAIKSYVDDTVNAKNVSAEGDSYVSASAAGNKVTVAATDSLKNAIDKANSAIQKLTILGHDLTDGGEVTVAQAKTDLGLGSAAYVNVESTMGNTTGVPQTKVVKSYVDSAINDVKSLVTASTQFLGVSTTKIEDGASTPTTVNNKAVGAGDIAMYGTSEFIWDGAKWVLLGDTTAEAAAIDALEGRMQDVEDDLATYIPKVDNLVNGTTTVKSFGGQAGDITVDTATTTAGDVKFSMSGKQLKGAVNGWSDVSSKAGSALQSVAGSTYISATTKANNSQTISAKMQDMATASTSKKGIAEAYDVKSYVDGKFNDLSNQIAGLDGITSDDSTAAVTKVATSVTQTDGKVTVQYTEFVALTTAEIEGICK